MMNDKHIEDLLRNTIRVTPPSDMRDRTLRLIRQELIKRQTRFPWLIISRWKAALVACSVLIIVITGISDSARQERIGNMICGTPVSTPQAQIAQASALQQWENRQAQILAKVNEIEGRDAL